MTSFEFEIKDNLSGTSGEIDGYFSVKSNSIFVVSGIIQAVYDLRDHTQETVNQNCIPLILNEFSQGAEITKYLVAFRDQIPGLVTFGADEDAFTTKKPTESHLGIIARELATDGQFVAPLCRTPNNLSISSWEVRSPLLDFDRRYGSIVVEDSVCIVSIDESVSPLPALVD